MREGIPAPTRLGYRSPSDTGRRHALWDLATKADDSIRHRLAKIEAGEASGTLSDGERAYLETYISTLRDLAAAIRDMPGYR